MTLPDLFQNSSFTWVSGLQPSRNQFVSFETEFEYQDDTPIVLHLFADTRFRLFVNQTFVAYGPARFVTQFAEYDSYDLDPFLTPGPNKIRVEVNYYGASSFQSMPDGLPGFIAAGGSADGGLSFATPGNWRACIHQAWDPQSPLFSFAQNPAEILDTRVLETELDSTDLHPVAPLAPSQAPWTTLRQRSAPYPEYRPMHPGRILLAAPGENNFHRIGIQLQDPDYHHYSRKNKFCKKRQLTAWIHSESDQHIQLESFWSEVELNGQPCELDSSSLQGNHGFLHVELKKGWNFYSANVEQLAEHWSHLLGWPTNATLSVHAKPDLNESAPWALSPEVNSNETLSPPTSPEAFELPEGWETDSGDLSRVSPARLVAWIRPDLSNAQKDLPWQELSQNNYFHTATAIWTLDFQDQFYGHPVIDLDAPAGSILEVAYDDWKREDGCVNLFHSNPYTDATDRFILKGGRQTVEVLNPRGGIYLQLVLRSPDGQAVPFTLHNVFIRSRQILKQKPLEAAFHCDDQVMDWAWATSINTILASTDEAYADCPWRERGSYIGDSLVNLHLHRLISPDLSIARRTFRMMGEGQHLEGPRKGQLASVTPAWHRKGHDDFTLIWILCLRDYWQITGDHTLLEETWPVIQRIWESPVWKPNASGLWDVTDDMHLFIDWGVQKVDRTGPSNLVLNLFRLGALRATLEIETVLKKDSTSTEAAINGLLNALNETLWREDQGRFAASGNSDTPCLHGQVLALAFEAGDTARILDTIEPELLGNFEQGIEQGQSSGHIELYFHYYLLPALDRMGRNDLAEAFIHPHFEFLKGLGYPTLNECFCRAQLGRGSCCHSWSAAPAIYATRYILGLRQREPGNPDVWIVDPHSSAFDHAQGTLPHANGPIRVSWTRTGGDYDIHIEAPEGVEVLQLTH